MVVLSIMAAAVIILNFVIFIYWIQHPAATVSMNGFFSLN